MLSKRNVNVDLMRLFGLFVIIMAHANPPGWIFQLRNFGTPLLIVASAITYSIIYGQRTLETGRFLAKRLPRLVFPAWLFLSVFFLLFFFAAALLEKAFPFTVEEIASSFLLYDGIGYVWILKVYIFLALMTPWALNFSKSTISNRHYFGFLVIVYALYELSLPALQSLVSISWVSFFDSTVFTILPYGLLYLYGMRLSRLSNFSLLAVTLASLVFFVSFAVFKRIEAGEFISTQYFKYPPTLYYLIYSFFFVNGIYFVARNVGELSGGLRNIVIWLSSNSLWIYLWHILAIFCWDFSVGEQPILMSLFVAKFVFILAFGICVTYAQVSIVKRLFSDGGFFGRKIMALLT